MTLDLTAFHQWPAWVEVLNAEHQPLLIDCLVAKTAWLRMRGLIMRPEEQAARGLLLVPCSAIHTVGMGYPIDVAFLEQDGRIMRLDEAVLPGRLMLSAWGAAGVLELSLGGAQRLQLAAGERLMFRAPRASVHSGTSSAG